MAADGSSGIYWFCRSINRFPSRIKMLTWKKKKEKKRKTVIGRRTRIEKRESCQVEFVTRVMPCVKLCCCKFSKKNYYTFSDSFNEIFLNFCLWKILLFIRTCKTFRIYRFEFREDFNLKFYSLFFFYWKYWNWYLSVGNERNEYYRIIKFARVSSTPIRICRGYRYIIQLAVTRKPLRRGQS